jgi:hypothetical protein
MFRARDDARKQIRTALLFLAFGLPCALVRYTRRQPAMIPIGAWEQLKRAGIYFLGGCSVQGSGKLGGSLTP